MFYRLWRLTVTLPDICQCYLSLGVTRAIMGTGEQQKLQRLAELEVRIKDLDVGVKSSQSETAGFIQSVNQQLEQFEWMKNREIGTFLMSRILVVTVPGNQRRFGSVKNPSKQK